MGMLEVVKLGLTRERVSLKPVKQPGAVACDNVHLRVVDMSINKAWNNQFPAVVQYWLFGFFRYRRGLPEFENVAILANPTSAIFDIVDRCVVVYCWVVQAMQEAGSYQVGRRHTNPGPLRHEDTRHEV